MSEITFESRHAADFAVEYWDASASDVEQWLSSCEAVAELLGRMPEDGQADLIELLIAMGRSEEERVAGRETIEEMLSPLVGTLLPMELPDSRRRHPTLQKWSSWVGHKVREFRKAAGMTQHQLSQKAGLPQSHISRIENGEISPTRLTIEKIAQALERAVSDFDPSP